MNREDMTPAEYALDTAIGLLGDWLSAGYPGVDHECLDSFPLGCPRCERVREEMQKLIAEMRKGDPAIKSLVSGHAKATRTRECLAMPGFREQSINTPGVIIDAILHVWNAIAFDPCSNPGSIVPASLNCILLRPPSEPLGGGEWLEKSGLDLDWPAFTYCNPPWGELEKWLAHGSKFSEVIWLVPVRSQRDWFQHWLDTLDVRINLRPLRFLGFPQPYPAPVMMGYRGCHAEQFERAFARLGRAA